MWSAIGSIITLIVLLIKEYLKAREKRKIPYEKFKKDIKEFDDALAHGDASLLGRKFDELRKEAGICDPAIKGDQETS